MSELKSVCRCRACYVSHTLYASLQPDAALQLRPPSTVQPWTLFRNLFHTLYQRGGPDTVFYIHVRVSRGEFDQCVAYGSSGSALPDLPFTADDKSAVIQASDVLYLSNLQSFLPDTEWTPVVGKLWSDQRYQNAFVSRYEGVHHYIDLRGPPALGKGGRGRKKSTAPDAAAPPTPARLGTVGVGAAGAAMRPRAPSRPPRCGRAPRRGRHNAVARPMPTPPPRHRPRGSGPWAAAQPGRRRRPGC